ncbi:MAG: MFS transporter [Clostridia bacterium]|nr:MFS transporter [Clostridia bacterium]
MNNTLNQEKDIYKVSRGFQIAFAALEYFISILVGTTYLAKLGTAVGLDDGTIGLVTSFLALGCSFQLVSIFLGDMMNKKRNIILFTAFNQLCFLLLYLVPFIRLPSGTRIWIFIGLILAGNILLNIVAPRKTAWSRGLVREGHLGRYSALNEIVSLVSGMLFSFAMGAIIDALEAQNRLMLAFGIIGAVIFLLSACCTVCLLVSKQKPLPKRVEEKPLLRIKSAFSDRATLLLIPLYVLWNIAIYSTTPFFSTYAINELGFSMTVISVISAAYALLRAVISRPFGALGDRRGFVGNLTIGIFAFAVSLVVIMLGGRASYVIYQMLYAVVMACTNSALIILIFNNVAEEKRPNSLAVLYSLGGVSGFLTTLAVRPLVNYIQVQGNEFLFLENVYAQQVVCVIGIAFSILSIIYTNTVVRRMERARKEHLA